MLIGLTGCTGAAHALNARLAETPAPDRLSVLSAACAEAAVADKFGPTVLTASCASMGASLRRPVRDPTAQSAFEAAYQACLDEAKRDGAMFTTRWHRGRPGFYRDARAVCDAYKSLFSAGDDGA